MNNKAYLGDSVYVEDLGNEVILTTENGIETTNRIYLEEEVIQAFIEFCQNRKVEKTP